MRALIVGVSAIAVAAPYVALGYGWMTYGDLIRAHHSAETTAEAPSGAPPGRMSADAVEALRAEFKPAPAFVTSIDPVAPDEAEYAPMAGFRILLLDWQHDSRGDAPALYSRFVVEIVSESGVEQASTRSITFDPEHQWLEFHNLSVIRDGERLDRSETAEIDFARRERNFERRMFDGRLSALVRVPDVRVGDLIEFSYTLYGRNPVFGENEYRSFGFGFSVPVERQRIRSLWSGPDGPALLETRGGELPAEAVVTSLPNGDSAVEVGPFDLPAVNFENGAPRWALQVPVLYLSAYESWADFAAWAEPLFEVEPGPEVQPIAAQIMRAHDSDEDRAIAALRWVQREIQYFAVSLGVAGWVPTPPAETLETRTGDCKATTALLIALLKAMDIDAHGVLVDLDAGEGLNTASPGPVFDHIIARAQINGRWIYMDPTNTHQGGDFDRFLEPDYGYALPLDGVTRDLIDMDISRRGIPNVSGVETIDMTGGPDAPVRLTYQRTMRDASADRMRSSVARSGEAGFQRSMVDFYNGQLGEVTLLEPMGFEDDLEANTFNYTLDLEIAAAFTANADEARREFDFYAHDVRFPIDTDAERSRRSPLNVREPMHQRHEVVVRVAPEAGWDWPERDQVLESEWMWFRHTARWEDETTYVMVFEQRTNAETVPAADASEAFALVDSMRDLRSYELPAP